jgi:putative CocE/NonD family hydrolase
MRDGVRIAIDVHLPKERPSRVPAIVRSTCYYRGIHLREPFARLGVEWLIDHAAGTRARFLAAGYAWIDVCARGSGASFGWRPCPWSPEEIADGREIIEWIVRQPWSSGMVGATGVSYDGTAADFLVVAGHPALKAIAPRFSLFDTYADVAFPGGIHLAGFTVEWARFNRALDGGRLDEAFIRKIAAQLKAWRAAREDRSAAMLARAGEERLARAVAPLLKVMSSGVRKADGDDGRLLASAIDEHRKNLDVHAAALGITHRDDAGASDAYPDATIDFFSPHAHLAALRASDATVYSMSGWLDGAYAHSAVKRFRTLRRQGARLTLGPWEHGGMQNISPYSRSRAVAFDQDGELVRFFDRHLRGWEVELGAPVRYFTVGRETWRESSEWPPRTRAMRWYLGEARRLTPIAPRSGRDEYVIDRHLGMGPRTRYDALLGLLPPVGYPQAQTVDGRMLVYRSDPLEEDLEVTGHPIARLTISAEGSDGHVFAYLQEELPDGTVHWISDGQLRVAHRRLADRAPYDSPAPYRSFTRADWALLDDTAEIVFDLLPTSWLIRRGHRLRLAISGADRDHFAEPPPCRAMAFLRGPSHIELPVV